MITREVAKELLPIIQAFAEGKPIQDKIEGMTDWVDTDEINLEYEGKKIKHRIKPEPKYRPFQTQEECWKEMLKHQPFGWVKCKYTGNFASIGNISEKKDKKLFITWTTNEGYNFLASDVFNDYTFTDGEPFGIKDE